MWEFRRFSSRLTAIVLLLALSLTSFAQTFTAAEQKEILDRIAKIVTEQAFVPGVDFGKWPEYVEKRREQIDGAQSKSAFIREVNRALREFGTSHIRLRTARNEGPGGGGTLMQTSPPQAEPPKQEEKKEEVPAPPKPATQSIRWIDEESAVLRITTFSTGYSRAEVAKLVSEANAKAKYLLLDLRGNGGGATGNLQHLLSLLMEPDTVIGTFVSRGDAKRFAEETKGDPNDPVAIAKWAPRKFKTRAQSGERYKGALGVLIDRGSGSASEITAAALKESRKAPLIGGPTAGAVLLSTFMKLPHGLEIQIPLRDFVTKDGVRLEGNPLKPDLPVLTRDREKPIEEGFAILKKAS